MNAQEKLTHHILPKVGLRNIKTALAAALCALVYYFLDRSPAFACIGAIFGMGSSYEQSRLHGGNRFFGTLVGGFIGMGLFAFYMHLFPDGSHRWFLVPLTFIGVVILIVLCQYIWVGGVQPGGDAAENAAIARFVEAWWPTLDAETLLRDLLTDGDLLARFAPQLSAKEIAAVVAEPAPWASSDIPLLDAVADLLGDSDAPQQQGEFVADHARRHRGWVYGHVAVDEAQELSEMQWHMVVRRCPSRSITAVGDIDQAEAAHRHTSWAQAVQAVLGDRWTPAELTICYRTPPEVMELTEPVLRHAGSHNAPPRAVRASGISPWVRTITPADLCNAAAEAVRQLRERWHGGTVGVIAPADRIAELQAAVNDDVPVLSAAQSKGLEWDATLLVDPDGITAEPRGWNGLYVALKHYDLADREDLDGLLDELVRLLVDDKLPPSSFVFRWPGTPG